MQCLTAQRKAKLLDGAGQFMNCILGETARDCRSKEGIEQTHSTRACIVYNSTIKLDLTSLRGATNSLVKSGFVKSNMQFFGPLIRYSDVAASGELPRHYIYKVPTH